MKVYRLHRKQVIPEPLEEVFAFFSRPENLARITPPSLGFKILTPSPAPMHRGALIDYVIHVFGMPVRWCSLITTYDPPHCFVDEQLRGPYDFWHHTHRFEACAAGTRVSDYVSYSLPLGPLGRLGHMLFVHRQLRSIFEHRAQAIQSIFATRDVSSPEPPGTASG